MSIVQEMLQTAKYDLPSEIIERSVLCWPTKRVAILVEREYEDMELGIHTYASWKLA